MSDPSSNAGNTPQLVEEQLYCALTGRPVASSEAYWAPPLITARELISTILSTLFTAPATLGQLLMAEQPNVPYAPDVREQLAARRSAEQLKLLVLLLAIGALIVIPLLLLVLR
ncbi:MAG TPA: hypothetical protein PKA05_11890 [Roseiflexaceae bacterium]|nr:hypothetical protein [Roseiflexaceae bacterium]